MNSVFTNYRKNIIYNLNDSQENITEEAMIAKSNLKKSGLAGLIFFFLNCYYLISDLTRGFYSTPHAWPNLIAILLLMIPSIYIFTLSLLKHEKYDTKLIRFSLLFYYICIIISVTIFNYTLNVRAIDERINSEFIGITLSTVYLIYFIVAPLSKLVDSLIVIGFILATMIMLKLLPGNEMFGLFRHISFRFIVIVGYFFFRNQDHILAQKNIKINAMNHQLLESSYTDNLTGALNRNALDNFLAHLKNVDKVQKFGIIMFDIDYFKIYNDTYSHSQGDIALKKVCDAIATVLSSNDPYLFRFGGEEFIIITTNLSDEDMIKCAQKYQKAIANANITRKDTSPFDHLTISIGCAEIAFKDDPTAFDYITAVDSQLYLCKSNGKNCVAMNDKLYR